MMISILNLTLIRKEHKMDLSIIILNYNGKGRRCNNISETSSLRSCNIGVQW